MLTLRTAMRLSASGDGKRSTPAIKVAVAAVALSVAVMLAAIAIVMGFKEQITRKVLGFNPHIVLKVNPQLSHDEYLASLTPSLKAILDSVPYITEYSLSASVPGIFKTDSDFKGIYLKSGNDRHLHDFLQSQLVEGKAPDLATDSAALLISMTAARQLGLKAGDKLPTYFITDDVRVKPLTVSGIFNSHFDTYDDIFAFGSLPMIQEVGNIDSHEGTAINIYVDDFRHIQDYAYDLRRRLDMAFTAGLIYKYYDIETALNSGANYFSWLAMLDTNVGVVLGLMTAVALITLISGMLIIIVDKTRFIAIMKSLGASNGQLCRIFIWLTLRVAAVGLIIGNALMLWLLLLQEKYHFIPLDPENYYIDFVPVEISWIAVVCLNVGILAIAFIMLLLPSLFVSTVSPSRSLRSE